MFARTKAERLAAILDSLPDEAAPPQSVIRDLRGSRSQQSVALKSRISQPHLSHLEAGTKPLTAEVAQRLGPALGVSPQRLQTADQVGRLREAALKGAVDPGALLMTIQDLSLDLPDDEVSDRLIDVLLMVLRDALAHWDAHQKAKAKVPAVSTKSAATPGPERTRDSLGRRRDKPHRRID